jgi:DNA-binding GntR family transcriptional regulator
MVLTSQTSPRIYQTKEEYVYDTLRAAIMRCDLKPGAKLVMDNLSVELDVSPIPIRGALQRLQAEGLVEIVPHSGAIVSSISPDTIDEIFLLLAALESTAFTVAAQKATDEEIVHLEGLGDEMGAALAAQDVDRWSDLNNQFHLAVARITTMTMLYEFTGRVLDSWDRLRRLYLQPFVALRINEAHAEHCQMIELLKQRDADGLAQLTAQHNCQAKELYQELIKGQQKQTD